MKSNNFRTIIKTIPSGLFALDLKFIVTVWNQEMEKITNLSKEQIIGRPLLDYFPKLTDTDLFKIYELAVSSEDIISLTNSSAFCPESTQYKKSYYSLKARTLFDKNHPTGCVVLLEDTTSSQMTQSALMESERRLSTLMDNLVGMAYRILNDEHWTLEYISKGSMDLLGFDSHYLQGNPRNRFSERVHPDDQEKVRKTIHAAVKEKKTFELFYRLKTADNVYKWVWEQGTGVFDKKGNLEALEGYVNDFTTPKATELELRRENERLRYSIKDRYRLGNMVGKSQAMQRVYELILKAAESDNNVIIYGETGTGKELAAKAIHTLSERKPFSFVPINCGAMSETLLESEFFGHIKGAFTGATKDKTGFLDVADKGTLFLDELGEISLPLQVKLLRFLDGEGYSPVGSTLVKKTDIKIVAATNRHLKEEVIKGKIRKDFFYRIHILPIYLPPLRERKEDIPLLIDYFLDIFEQKGKKATIPADVREAMIHYHWPGNVRELQNTILRYITLKQIDFLEEIAVSNDRSRFSKLDMNQPKSLKSMTAAYEKKIILQMLEQHQWNRTRVAKLLGIDRKTLFTKIKQHKLLAAE